MVSSPNKVLKTFFRSATHDTDSTLSGWTANNAATKKLRHWVPVARNSNQKSKATLKECSRMLTKWWPTGFSPNNWQSSMCESQVIGCQLETSKVVNAQWIPALVSP